jgi:hypothetical protein
VLSGFGTGFLEKVCEDALARELGKAGVAVVRRHGPAWRVVLGDCIMDLMDE